MAEDRLVPDKLIKDEDRLVPDNMIRPEDAVAPAGSEPESIYKDGTPWYKELAFNLALAGSNSNPTRFATTPLGQQVGSNIVSGATSANLDGGAREPATALEKGFAAFGQGAGMTVPFLAAAPALARLGLAAAPVGFAAYEAARPADSLSEHLDNAKHGALMGTMFTGLGAVGGAVARKMPGLLKPVTRPAIDTAALTGLNVAQGMEPDDALLNAAPFVMGGSIAHAATGAPKRTGDQKLSKTPAEREAPDFVSAELRQMQAEAAAREASKLERTTVNREGAVGRVREAQGRVEAETANKVSELRAKEEQRIKEDAEIARQRYREIERRRAAAQAEQQAAAEQAKRDKTPGSDYYLGTGIAGKEQMVQIKRNADRALTRDEAHFRELKEAATSNVAESPESIPFSMVNRGELNTLSEVAYKLHDLGTIKSTRDFPQQRQEVPYDRSKVGATDVDYYLAREQAIKTLERDIGQYAPELVAEVRQYREGIATRAEQAKARDAAKSQRSVKDRFFRRNRPPEADKTAIVERSAKRSDATDRLRHYQNMSGHRQDSPLMRATIRGDHQIDMATSKLAHGEASRINEMFNEAGIGYTGRGPEIAYDLLRKFGSYQNEAKFLADKEVQGLLVESGQPRKMLDLVRSAREWLDATRRAVATTDRAMEDPVIGQVENYVPKRAAEPGAFNLPGKIKLRRAMEKESERLGVSSGEQVFLSQRMHRKAGADPNKVEVGGKEFPVEKNLWQLMQDYAAESAKAIGGSAAMHKNARIAKYLELSGMPGNAEIIARTSKQAYGGEKHGVSKAIDAGAGATARTILGMNKRLFDRAHYGFNPKFVFGRQHTSLAPYAVQHPRAAIEAVADLSNPAARESVLSVYAAVVKGQKSARVSEQSDGSFASAPPATKRKMIADQLERGMSDAMERYTVLFGGLMAHRVGRGKGMKGEELARFVSDEIGKYQSFYDAPNRAGMLNSRMVQGTFPAQSWSVDNAHNVLEQFGKSGAGLGYSPLRRAYNITAIIAANSVMAAIYSAIGGYAVKNLEGVGSTIASQIPFAGPIFGVGPNGGAALTAGQISDVWNALKAFERGEELEGLRYLARNWMPGGVFAGDAATGRTEDQIQNTLRLLGVMETEDEGEPLGPPAPSTLSRTPAQGPRPRVVRPRPPARQPARRP